MPKMSTADVKLAEHLTRQLRKFCRAKGWKPADLARAIGIPLDADFKSRAAKVYKWLNKENPPLFQSATLAQLSKTGVSLDWLFGRDVPMLVTEREPVGELARGLGSEVAMRVQRRLPRQGFWKSFVHYWRTDGETIIADAADREIACFNRASAGLDDLEENYRTITDREVAKRGTEPRWPVRGETTEQRREQAQRDSQLRQYLVTSLVRELKREEFMRRMNDAIASERAPLVSIPPSKPSDGDDSQPEE